MFERKVLPTIHRPIFDPETQTCERRSNENKDYTIIGGQTYSLLLGENG